MHNFVGHAFLHGQTERIVPFTSSYCENSTPKQD